MCGITKRFMHSFRFAIRVVCPQKSVAVLMGLGQFGVSRIVFKDEIVGGNVQRFTGPLRSIIIFDQEELTTGKRDEIFFEYIPGI